MPKKRAAEQPAEVRSLPPAARRAVVGVLATADRVRSSLNHLVGSRGLTFQQFNVLRILRGAGELGLPTLQIGERMVEKTPGLTGLLDRLVAKGLVDRRRCDRDRRRVYCTLTAAGSALLATLDGPVDGWEADVLRNLSVREVERLVALLEAVQTALDPSAAPHRPTTDRVDPQHGGDS